MMLNCDHSPAAKSRFLPLAPISVQSILIP